MAGVIGESRSVGFRMGQEAVRELRGDMPPVFRGDSEDHVVTTDCFDNHLAIELREEPGGQLVTLPKRAMVDANGPVLRLQRHDRGCHAQAFNHRRNRAMAQFRWRKRGFIPDAYRR